MSYINSNLNFPNADELIEYLIGRVDNISISAHSYLDQEDVEKLNALSLELTELKAKQTKDIEDVKKLIDNIELTGTPIDVSGLKSRIEALEAKQDKDTVYDDSEIKRRISELEAKPAVNTDQLVTKDELAKELAKDVEVRFDEAILNDYLKSLDAELSYVKKTELSTQPSFITLSNRVTTLETRPSGNGTAYDDTELRGRVESLENTDTEIKQRLGVLESKTDNDTIYNDAEIKQRLTALEEKPDKDTVYDDTALKNRVEALEQRPAGSGIAYDDTEVKNRLTALEEKPDKDTVYDDTALKNRVEALEQRPAGSGIAYDDTEVKNRLTALETKPDKDTVYDDTSIKYRLDALESKADNDTVYNDSELRGRVEALEQRPAGTSYDDSALTARVAALETKPDKDTVYDDSALKARVETLEQRPAVNTENFVTKEQLATELSGKLTSADLSGLLTKTQADNDYATKQELQSIAGGKSEFIDGTIVGELFTNDLNPGYKLKKNKISDSIIYIYNENAPIFKTNPTKLLRQWFVPGRGSTGTIKIEIDGLYYYTTNDILRNSERPLSRYAANILPLHITAVTVKNNE